MKTSQTSFMPSRRLFLVSGVTLASGALAWGFMSTSSFAGATLSPVEAHQQALSGAITLVDIRRPDEWAETGSGQGSHRLDMRRDDFMTELDRLVGGDRSKPVALMCARGVRSDRMSQRLVEAGFTNVIDVPEGMLGSRAGPGWLDRGLPLIK